MDRDRIGDIYGNQSKTVTGLILMQANLWVNEPSARRWAAVALPDAVQKERRII